MVSRGRAGLLGCSCDFDPPDEDAPPAGEAGLGFVAAGFAFAVLSQALAFAALPLAGAPLAPSRAAATLPVALLLAGAAVATFPASFLTGLFGRRSSFALGASLGVAGAAIGAWGVLAGVFAGLCLGAFWLGVAQGFGLFYRHAAGGGGRGAMIVLGAGSLAALAAPSIAGFARETMGPLAAAGALIGAGLAQLVVLALAAPLPSGFEDDAAAAQPAPPDARLYALVTGAAALAWFGMMALMAGAPLAMVDCGLGLSAASGAVAWHLVAMYAPAGLVGALRLRAPPLKALGAGLCLLAFAGLLLRVQMSAQGFDLVLIGGGLGWSLATLGATLWLKREGVSRLRLALHDFALFCGATLGALAAAAFA
ncbi:hypothetical protein [Methylocella sp.]|uniref:hypothetical protein n=1 Tax=Methylocella sp. TaxID=1978226 RepID=UPI003784F7E4